MSKSKDQKAFALPDSLRDLALLRASDIDLAGLIPNTNTSPKPDDSSVEDMQAQAIEETLAKSLHYVKAARNAIRINDRGDVDIQGQRVEKIREQLLNVEEGLADASTKS